MTLPSSSRATGEKVGLSPRRSKCASEKLLTVVISLSSRILRLTHVLFLLFPDRIKLQGLEFPYTFELTFNNLLFPLTKETWEKDNRAFDDLGISALLDLDGKFSTANENDLLGFGISKPVAIAGSQV